MTIGVVGFAASQKSPRRIPASTSTTGVPGENFHDSHARSKSGTSSGVTTLTIATSGGVATSPAITTHAPASTSDHACHFSSSQLSGEPVHTDTASVSTAETRPPFTSSGIGSIPIGRPATENTRSSANTAIIPGCKTNAFSKGTIPAAIASQSSSSGASPTFQSSAPNRTHAIVSEGSSSPQCSTATGPAQYRRTECSDNTSFSILSFVRFTSATPS